MTHRRAALQTLPLGETIAKALSIAPKSARRIVQELGLRKLTGRGASTRPSRPPIPRMSWDNR
ncbi:helix-turn-helix domain-containing protein [Rhizobium sp. 2YAF20]|uniref:helix-turn-helix domain-containing protein n=1 Tax=Rhizobium sp. 2YAF20 TaxID=3233027 RepID=UPI003F9AA46C